MSLLDSLGRRKDRSLAIILNQKERECDQYLPPEAAKKMRKVILDQVNEFHDFAADMMRSVEAGVPNEEYFVRLEDLMSTLEKAVSSGGKL